MPGMAAKVIVTERQQQMLQSLAFSRGCPQGLAHRAEIVLLAFDGLKNEEIAKKLHCERHGVPIDDRPARSDSEVHRLLQRHDGEAIQMDVCGSAVECV